MCWGRVQSCVVKAQNGMINLLCTSTGKDDSQPIVKYAHYNMLVGNLCI